MRAVAVGLVLLCCAAACTGSPQPRPSSQPATPQPATTSVGEAFTAGRVAHPLALPGLRVDLAPGAPRLRAADAARTLAATEPAHAAAQAVAFGYGLVTLDPRIAAAGTPLMRHRLAWVAVLTGFVSACPAERSAPATPSPAPGPAYTVLILDATRGDTGAEYRNPQSGGCGGPVLPAHADPLLEQVSLPWQQVSLSGHVVVLAVQVPTCTALSGATSSRSDTSSVARWQVIADRSLRSGCRGSRRQQVREQLDPAVSGLTPGPTGPVEGAPGSGGAALLRLAGAAPG